MPSAPLSGAARRQWPLALELALALAAALPGALIILMRSDGILFNYFNNVVAPEPVFFFNGWVHLLPELVAYAARHLPATAQGAIYAGFAVLAAAVMLREFYHLLRLWLTANEAALFALVALLYLQFYVPVLAQLIWSVWTIAIAVCCHVLRKNIAGERYSAFGLAASVVGGWSNPTAVILIPLLGYFAWITPDKILRRQNLFLAVAFLAFFAAAALVKPQGARYLASNPFIGSARVLWHQLYEPSRHALVPLAAAMALVWRGWRALGARDGPQRTAVLALAYVGFASLGLYLFTGRAEISSSLPARYAILIVMCGIAALAIDGFPRLDIQRRRIVFLSVGAIALACEIVLVSLRFDDAATRVHEQFAFTADAPAFRDTCQPGEALLQRATPSRAVRIYPFILCSRLELKSPGAAAFTEVVDGFGNTYLQGLRARLWRSQETAPVELFVPRR